MPSNTIAYHNRERPTQSLNHETIIAFCDAHGSALLSARASHYLVDNVNGSGTSLGLATPDVNASGITSSLNISGAGSPLSDLTVTLDVSGGYNGGLYFYLVAPNGTGDGGICRKVGRHWCQACLTGFAEGGGSILFADRWNCQQNFAAGLGSRHQVRIRGSGLGWVAALLGWHRHPNPAATKITTGQNHDDQLENPPDASSAWGRAPLQLGRLLCGGQWIFHCRGCGPSRDLVIGKIHSPAYFV